MLSSTLFFGIEDDDLVEGPSAPALSPLPALELCVAQPTVRELWHVDIGRTSSRGLSLVCVSGMSAAVALMVSPLALSTVRRPFTAPSVVEPKEARCGMTRCPLQLGSPFDTCAASHHAVPPPLPFLYSYHTDTHSHEVGDMAATVVMSTLRRHLMRVFGFVRLSEPVGHSRQCQTQSSASQVSWCGNRLASIVRAHCDLVTLPSRQENQRTSAVITACVRVRWTPALVAALATSWEQYRQAPAHEVDETALAAYSMLHGLALDVAASAVVEAGDCGGAAPSAVVAVTQPRGEAAQDEAMEAWSDEGDGTISDLDKASDCGARTGVRSEEDEHAEEARSDDGATTEASTATPSPPSHHADGAVTWEAVYGTGACPSHHVHSIAWDATLRMARTAFGDQHARVTCGGPGKGALTATSDQTRSRQHGTRVSLQCTQLEWESASREDVWLASHVGSHLLEHFLLPADRHRDDGNDLLHGTQPGASAEAAATYLTGVRIAQEGLAYPYTIPLHLAREGGSYTSTNAFDATASAAALDSWMRSRDAVYEEDQSTRRSARAQFVAQRVWKPMASSEAAGVFARVLLRVHPLPPDAAIDSGLAYTSAAVAARSPYRLHPCLGPALAAVAWRRRRTPPPPTETGAALPDITLLQLVWYSLHRTAVVLTANTAEATLRALADTTGAAAVALGDVQCRAQACEKASGLVWGLLHWHQPAGLPPLMRDSDDTPDATDGEAWSALRSSDAQAELLWCFQMYSKLMLRAARLWKSVADDARHSRTLHQLRASVHLWMSARRRRHTQSERPRWNDVPVNTPEVLVCELTEVQWTSLLSDVESSLRYA